MQKRGVFSSLALNIDYGGIIPEDFDLIFSLSVGLISVHLVFSFSVVISFFLQMTFSYSFHGVLFKLNFCRYFLLMSNVNLNASLLIIRRKHVNYYFLYFLSVLDHFVVILSIYHVFCLYIMEIKDVEHVKYIYLLVLFLNLTLPTWR